MVSFLFRRETRNGSSRAWYGGPNHTTVGGDVNLLLLNKQNRSLGAAALFETVVGVLGFRGRRCQGNVLFDTTIKNFT